MVSPIHQDLSTAAVTVAAPGVQQLAIDFDVIMQVGQNPAVRGAVVTKR